MRGVGARLEQRCVQAEKGLEVMGGVTRRMMADR